MSLLDLFNNSFKQDIKPKRVKNPKENVPVPIKVELPEISEATGFNIEPLTDDKGQVGLFSAFPEKVAEKEDNYPIWATDLPGYEGQVAIFNTDTHTYHLKLKDGTLGEALVLPHSPVSDFVKRSFLEGIDYKPTTEASYDGEKIDHSIDEAGMMAKPEIRFVAENESTRQGAIKRRKMTKKEIEKELGFDNAEFYIKAIKMHERPSVEDYKNRLTKFDLEREIFNLPVPPESDVNLYLDSKAYDDQIEVILEQLIAHGDATEIEPHGPMFRAVDNHNRLFHYEKEIGHKFKRFNGKLYYIDIDNQVKLPKDFLSVSVVGVKDKEGNITPLLNKALGQAEPNPMYVGGIDPYKQKLYIAVDPGKSGAIVGMTSKEVLFKTEMPIIGDDLDALKLDEIIRSAMNEYDCVLTVEDVHSIYGVSASNNFVFGWVCGQIDAVITLSKVKHNYVQPKFWQKQIWTHSDMVYQPLKKDQKKPSIDTKATSLNAVRRLFPNEDIRGHIEIKYYGKTKENQKLNRVGSPIPTRKNSAHDGIVDALLMCEMARRLNY